MATEDRNLTATQRKRSWPHSRQWLEEGTNKNSIQHSISPTSGSNVQETAAEPTTPASSLKALSDSPPEHKTGKASTTVIVPGSADSVHSSTPSKNSDNFIQDVNKKDLSGITPSSTIGKAAELSAEGSGGELSSGTAGTSLLTFKTTLEASMISAKMRLLPILALPTVSLTRLPTAPPLKILQALRLSPFPRKTEAIPNTNYNHWISAAWHDSGHKEIYDSLPPDPLAASMEGSDQDYYADVRTLGSVLHRGLYGSKWNSTVPHTDTFNLPESAIQPNG
ncbi:hypothetical protein BDV96DRAFT_607724 [Lophiotrema nucula]|uniref:Uncharacterized protein n=1 Tax=Lophiotrema nucula TaxID=690887 RepID=A0A6A5YFK6_9PLEO|nr:hypothetical protein BDV96DRAFT_607724 [Lophiotrema nucula]